MSSAFKKFPHGEDSRRPCSFRPAALHQRHSRHLFPEVDREFEGVSLPPHNLPSCTCFRKHRRPAPVQSRGRTGTGNPVFCSRRQRRWNGEWVLLSRGKAALPPIRRRATLDRRTGVCVCSQTAPHSTQTHGKTINRKKHGRTAQVQNHTRELSSSPEQSCQCRKSTSNQYGSSVEKQGKPLCGTATQFISINGGLKK